MPRGMPAPVRAPVAGRSHSAAPQENVAGETEKTAPSSAASKALIVIAECAYSHTWSECGPLLQLRPRGELTRSRSRSRRAVPSWCAGMRYGTATERWPVQPHVVGCPLHVVRCMLSGVGCPLHVVVVCRYAIRHYNGALVVQSAGKSNALCSRDGGMLTLSLLGTPQPSASKIIDRESTRTRT